MYRTALAEHCGACRFPGSLSSARLSGTSIRSVSKVMILLELIGLNINPHTQGGKLNGSAFALFPHTTSVYLGIFTHNINRERERE